MEMTSSIGYSIGSIGFIIAYILFVKNLMSLLLSVQPDNRQVQPGIVWVLTLLLLMPIITLPFDLGLISYEYFPTIGLLSKVIAAFMSVFQFYLSVKIANSLSLEYDNRGIYYEHKPTFLAGVWLAIAYTSTFLLNFFNVFYLSIFTTFGYFIAFVVYWVQISQAKKKLNNTSIKIETTEEDSIFKGL